MPKKRSTLDSTHAVILELIAQGCSYDQILHAHPTLKYTDIFAAARAVLDIINGVENKYTNRLAHIRKEHPRAYERWTEKEDETLKYLVASSSSVRDIAELLQRQPGAIRSRMMKLDLTVADCSSAPKRT